MSEIRIISLQDDDIRIDISGRTYPEENDKWDGNWLNAKIVIKAGKFSGKTDALLRSDELKRLSEDISLLLQGKKERILFSPMEPWISFQFMINKQRNIELSGEVTDRLGTGNILKFHCECSQPILGEMLERISSILKEFPVK